MMERIAIILILFSQGCASICSLQTSILDSAEESLLEIDLVIEERDNPYNDAFFIAGRALSLSRELIGNCDSPIETGLWFVLLREIMIGIGSMVMQLDSVGIPIPEKVNEFFDLFRRDE